MLFLTLFLSFSRLSHCDAFWKNGTPKMALIQATCFKRLCVTWRKMSCPPPHTGALMSERYMYVCTLFVRMILSYISEVVLMSFPSTLPYSPWSFRSINYILQTETCILPICQSLWTRLRLMSALYDVLALLKLSIFFFCRTISFIKYPSLVLICRDASVVL